jgi:hypothetical protein
MEDRKLKMESDPSTAHAACSGRDDSEGYGKRLGGRKIRRRRGQRRDAEFAEEARSSDKKEKRFNTEGTEDTEKTEDQSRCNLRLG